MKSNQTGATMMEALLVLSIIAIVGISGISLISSLFTMFKQYMVVGEIKEVQKNIATRYRVYGFYDNIPTTTDYPDAKNLIKAWEKENVLPSQMVLESSIRHRLGGKVTIVPRKRETDDDHYTYFMVTFEDIPPKTCFELGQIEWTMSQSSDLVELKINDTSFLLPTRDSGVAKGDDGALPAKPDVLLDACSKIVTEEGSTDVEYNTISWTFR